MTGQDAILLAAGVSFPVAFAVHVFHNNRRVYPRWAKAASVIIFMASVGWGALSWVLLHWRGFRLTREVYYSLVGIRGLFGGICLGFIFSLLIARSYRKARSDKPDVRQNE
jgi:hypothetical protein